MYKMTEPIHQISFDDFNQAYGFALDPKNDWVQRAQLIPWQKIEQSYAKMFPAKVGNVGKPLRMVLGSLIIQTKKQCSDAALVQILQENPYLQFFIGLPSFQSQKPFDSSSLVGFRKRMNSAFMQEANQLILAAIEETSDGEALPVETEKENNCRTALKFSRKWHKKSKFQQRKGQEVLKKFAFVLSKRNSFLYNKKKKESAHKKVDF